MTLLDASQRRDLLRVALVGSVDDGKSTLIGRLLYEAGTLGEDQLTQVRAASRLDGEGIDFSLFTDGLLLERQQHLTVDVAYRSLCTEHHQIIIADTPGHVRYTQNLATGISSADVAIVLVDASRGLRPESLRHAGLARLFGVRRLVVAVNKMDLVEFEQSTFERVREEFLVHAGEVPLETVDFVPISARFGDNVVGPSQRCRWYRGAGLLGLLDSIQVPGPERGAFRFPVQSVLRTPRGWTGLAGQIVSGQVSVGDAVVVTPSGKEAQIEAIHTYDGALQNAFAPMSVMLRLEPDVEVSRGDLLARAGELPRSAERLEANVLWLSDAPLSLSQTYGLKHTTRNARCRVESAQRLDLCTLTVSEADSLARNEVGRVLLSMERPLSVDAYDDHRATGCFILIDASSRATIAAGMVTEA